MSDTIISTNMSMPVPIVGVETGPQWATDINSCLTILDAHNHTTGYGVQIPPGGLNINSDLTIQSNNIIALRSTRFTAQGSPLALGTDLGCLYVSGVDLYYNDENGNQVRITQGGNVAGSTGSISGLSSPASASYSSGSTTFVWQSAANTSAYMDCSSILIRNLTASSKALTLQAPAAMAANYSLTLPPSVASTLIMTLDNAGTMVGQYALDNSTITAPGNVLTVGNNSISNTKLQSSSVDTTQLAAGSVTTAKLASNAVTDVKLASASVYTAALQDASVTQAKRAALGQIVSSSVTFSSGSTSFVDVTGLSINIATTGRPVFVGLIPDGTTSSASIGPTPSGAGVFNVEFLLDGTVIAVFNLSLNSGISAGLVPPGCYFTIDTLANASTHNYNVKAKISTGTFSFNNIKLIAYEL